MSAAIEFDAQFDQAQLAKGSYVMFPGLLCEVGKSLGKNERVFTVVNGAWDFVASLQDGVWVGDRIISGYSTRMENHPRCEALVTTPWKDLPRESVAGIDYSGLDYNEIMGQYEDWKAAQAPARPRP